MLKRFYDTWYAPNNAILIIVGDVEPSATLGRVRELFGPVARKDPTSKARRAAQAAAAGFL